MEQEIKIKTLSLPLICRKPLVMGVTRLKRKARRNKQTAAKRQNAMKQLSYQPVIKNIDREELKASFGQKEAPVVEEPVQVEDAPVAEEVKETVETPVAEAVEEEVVAEAIEETPDAVNEEAPVEDEKTEE